MSQTQSYRGRMFSRRAATGEDVTIQVSPGGLTVRRQDGTALSWAYSELQVARKPAPGGPVTFERGDDPPEAVVAFDPRILRAIQETAPGEAHRFPRPGSYRRPLVVLCAAAAILLLLGVLAVLRGLPLLADAGARRVPVAWEEKLGEATLAQLAPASRECQDAELRSTVEGIVSRLAAAAPPNPYTFGVRIIRDDTMNAFAAPGGHIVVFSGLLERTATPEELAGVLAHEMQHVIQRHTTENLLRRGSTGLLIAIIAGDQGALGQMLKTAEGLGALSYSRHDEEEADLEGMKLLRDAQIDPEGLLRFLRTLEREESRSARPLSFFSTHPGTDRRLENLTQMVEETESSSLPIETPVAWKDLVARCAGRLGTH